MIPHDIPNARFYKIGVDIMTFKSVDYLVVVDYFSKFPEMLELPDKTAATVTEKLKSVFARFGIPSEIVSDNMPFQSANFLKFADEWGFKTNTSSPNFPQSNGQVERTIQTLKRSLKKADCKGKDPYLSLLEYRNTPVAGLPYSPAQILMSKRLRSKIPCALNLLKPCVDDISESLSAAQYRQQVFYNRGTKPLPALREGERVYCKFRNRRESANVSRPDCNPRSYIVQSRHGLVRRNRRDLFRAPQGNSFNDDNGVNFEPSVAYSDVTTTTVPNVRTSDHGRTIRRLRKYADYIEY